MRTNNCIQLRKYSIQVTRRIFEFFWILMGILLAFACDAALVQPSGIIRHQGGTVSVQSLQNVCRDYCASPGRLGGNPVSLLAIPALGYRFQGWRGDCAKAPGPLCTVAIQGNAIPSARFSRVSAPVRPAKALLLLHGASKSYGVWNKLVQRYFNQRCPRIYGGGILDRDSLNAYNNVACYRIDFSYYKYLDLRITPTHRSLNQSAHEIGAAVVAIRSRLPGASLYVVAQEEAGRAAQRVLGEHPSLQKTVKGLLVLGGNKGRASANANTLVVDSIHATPAQTHLIDKALSRIAPNWWLAP
jgi:Divergent InlB B-repeat domain